MQLKIYLTIAFIAFVAAVTGSDLVARMTIGQLSLGEAISEHLEWASLTLIGILFLLAPFLCVAIMCAKAQRKTRARSVTVIFGASLIALMYRYFDAFQAAEQAMLGERWTAAALSIGLLPFFVGLPVVLLAFGATVIASRFDPWRA
ncbi:hypothetical protein [Sphingomonas sp.]|uniref:hypothetical protein n=1 Tax=Sphingomonas sp. TaxID=28214 RepID=UPI00286E791F|nr:hypothetical protein [Sphingomonas sp.]